MLSIKEVTCKSILTPSGLPHIDYSVNPYRGCEHGCVYCYARFIQRFINHKEEWGEFVDVKINAPLILSKEISRAKKGVVSLGTVTDAYQPIEKKYELTRKCLEKLFLYGFSVDILTKSSLVLRDIDILSQFNQNRLEVGFTITTVNEELRRICEPRASPVRERLQAVEELRRHGIQTYIFFGPILPILGDSEENLKKSIETFAETGVRHILVDRLNMRWGVWSSMKKFLEQYFPQLIPRYQHIFWSQNNYYARLKEKVAELCERYGLRYEFCY